jgi:hypothetical protein
LCLLQDRNVRTKFRENRTNDNSVFITWEEEEDEDDDEEEEEEEEEEEDDEEDYRHWMLRRKSLEVRPWFLLCMLCMLPFVHTTDSSYSVCLMHFFLHVLVM